MDVKSLLAQLREERDALDAAITNVERSEDERYIGLGFPPRLVTNSPRNRTNGGFRPPDPGPGEG